MDQFKDVGASQPTKQDFVFGVVAWLLLGPLALAVIGALVYEAAMTVSGFFGG